MRDNLIKRYSHAINLAWHKDREFKRAKVIIDVGLEVEAAWNELTPQEFRALMPLCKVFESEQGGITKDKHTRLLTIVRCRPIIDNIDKLPDTGWSTMRELPKLVIDGDERFMRDAFARGLINKKSKRGDIDALRGQQKGTPVASRHPIKPFNPEQDSFLL